MHTSFFTVLVASLAFAGVHAHFQLAFPPPWGAFVEDDEPTFCDGYKSTNATRTPFPLSGGFFTLNSEHPKWTAGVLISTVANPTSFNNFSQVNSFFQVSGEGGFCIPLDLSKSNATGLTQGENATIQIVFDGGDGQLYQCANVVLENNSTLLSNVTCTNATSATTTSSTTPSTSTTQKSAGIHQNPVGLIGSLSVLTLLIIALTQG